MKMCWVESKLSSYYGWFADC